ncbi:MAG: hypothetical protein BWK79_08445 [Beggiatoa sp. IS2]|nr:MAG: hypothetical protein BWK79_08445 [Beggiatoa sp. IS2]
MMIYFGLLFTIILILANGVRIYGLPFTSFTGEYAQRQNEVFNTLNLVADLKKAYLFTWLKERNNDVQVLAESKLLKNTIETLHDTLHQLQRAGHTAPELWTTLAEHTSYQDLIEHFKWVKSAHTTYHSIQVVDTSTGNVIASTVPSELGTNVSQEPFFMQALQPANDGLIDIKPAVLGHHLDLFLVRHLKRANNLFALLIMNINNDDLAAMLQTAHSGLGQTGEAFLITQNLQLLSPLQHPQATGLSFSALSEQLKTKLTEQEGSVETLLTATDFLNQQILAAYRLISIIDSVKWGLVVKVNRQEVFAPLHHSLFYMFLIDAILSFILGVLFTGMVARILSHPIKVLSQAIQRIEAGDMNARAEISTYDEIGVLADMFNSMVERVQHTQEEMERVIAESAIELRTSNFSLVMTVEEMQDLNTDLEQEIIERKKVELELRKERLQQQIIFDSVPAFIWQKDLKNHIMWMNKPAVELSGIQANTPVGYSVKVLFPEGTESAYREDLEVIQTGKPTLGILKQMPTVDGRTLWIKVDKVPYIEEDGQIIGVIVLAIDVTARIQAEQNLVDSEQRFRTIIDTAVDGIVMIDTYGVIQLANPSLARMFDYDMDELLGQNISVLLPKIYAEKYTNYLKVYRETGDKSIIGVGREIVGKHHNAGVFPIHLTISELVLNNQRMFTGIVSDITELKEAQRALELQNEELKEAQEALELQNKAYNRFVPREFLSFLGKESIVDVELGDQVQQEMTIMFSDIRSFTALSEKMTPNENFRFINSYLSKMEPVVQKNRGFIDKYIGDSIMALFPDGADDAVQGAIAMLYALAEFNQGRERAGYTPIGIGIGLHTGSLMLGTIGGKNRMDGTVISDAVNLASRVEGMTKMYGTSLLITENTYGRLVDLNQYHIRIIDKVKVKGKTQAITVYEVLDGNLPEIRDAKIATMGKFIEAFTAYQQRHLEIAEELFQECFKQNPQDKAVELYIKRCQYWQKFGDYQTWDGVIQLESKDGLLVQDWK